jgi:uncharacterized protein YndB with AHSA1/START domain
MNERRTLRLTTRGEREIVMTRVFDAPRSLVWDAFTKPELVQRWLLGPPGWSMPVCQLASKVGESYRYVWRGPKGEEMGAGGILKEFVPPERMVVTEQFDQPWYTGKCVVTIEFAEQNGRTTLTQTLRYESREAREMVLKSGMERGLGMSYDRLAEMLTVSAAT